MIGKITIELVTKCQNIIDKENLPNFQYILSSVLGEYNITEKQQALIPYNERLNKAYQMFFVAKKIEGLSDKSLKHYKSNIDNFLNFTSKSIDEVTTDDIRYYIATKQINNGISEVTANNIRLVLSTFFAWLVQEGHISKNPTLSLKKIKKKKQVKHAFTDGEIEKIKDACLTIKNPLSRKRNIAIIETLLSTGCRVGELTTMKISDIDFNKKSMIVLGKGNKERRVFLNDKAILRITQYLEERGENGDQYLFVSVDKPYERLNISGVECLIRKIGKQCGIKDCHPHKFRRTAATTAMKRGMNIIDIQRMLGHENLDTTKIYLDLDDTALENQHRKYM